nr:HAD family hydrolase [Candidatus Fermentithermobacillaceae bacterium]
MDKTAVPCNTNILASLSGVSTILFDLGGTLWSPFGTKTRDEVLESAIAGLIKDLKDTTGRDVSREDVEIGIVNLLFGLGRKNSGEYEPSLEDAALQEVDLQGVIGQFLSSERICLSEKKVSDLTDRFADSLSKYYLLYPETVTVLSTLKRRGYNIGIVSNTAMP